MATLKTGDRFKVSHTHTRWLIQASRHTPGMSTASAVLQGHLSLFTGLYKAVERRGWGEGHITVDCSGGGGIKHTHTHFSLNTAKRNHPPTENKTTLI